MNAISILFGAAVFGAVTALFALFVSFFLQRNNPAKTEEINQDRATTTMFLLFSFAIVNGALFVLHFWLK